MAAAAAAAKVAATKPLQLQLLEKQLKSSDPGVRSQGLDTIPILPVPVELLSKSISELFEHENLYVKQAAVEAIGRTATAKNKSCILALDQVGPLVKHEQLEIGRQAFAALLRAKEMALEDHIPEQRQPVSLDDAKQKRPPPPGPAETAAIKTAERLQDEDPRIRRQAVEVLTQMGPFAAPYCEGIASTLADRDIHVRNSVIHALGYLGVEARGGIAKAGEQLGHSDAAVRRSAAKAMVAIAAHSGEEAAEAVHPRLSSPDPAVRVIALEVMSSLGPLAAPYGSSLAKLLADRSPRVPEAAARALISAGPKVVKYLKHIKAHLLSENPKHRAAAELAMRGLSSQSAHVAAFASSMLRDHQTEDGSVVYQAYHRVHALRVLASAQENAVPYLNDLVNEMDRRDWALRRAAMEAFEELGVHARKAAREVAKRLSSPDKDIRRAAAETLGRMGKNATVYGQQLVGALRLESDRHVRDACEDAVERLKDAGVLDEDA